MKEKLCIVVSSLYSDKSYIHLNEEIECDLNTVQTTLSDHDCFNILLSVKASLQMIRQQVSNFLTEIKGDYSTCHIVLNTHGAHGKTDLKDEAVRIVLQGMSSRQIKIIQLSALQCHAMSPLSANEARLADPMMPVHKKAHAKPASMSILQDKLNAMTTKIIQNFKILGLASAYDPKENQTQIHDLLLGKGESFLVVTTQLHIEISAEQIFKCIEFIKEPKTEQEFHSEFPKNYHEATNIVGAIFTKIKEQIVVHLENQQSSLAAEYQPLLDAIIENTQIGELNDKTFPGIYKKWIKNNKIHSKERIDVLMDYAKMLASQTIMTKLSEDNTNLFFTKNPDYSLATDKQANAISELKC